VEAETRRQKIQVYEEKESVKDWIKKLYFDFRSLVSPANDIEKRELDLKWAKACLVVKHNEDFINWLNSLGYDYLNQSLSLNIDERGRMYWLGSLEAIKLILEKLKKTSVEGIQTEEKNLDLAKKKTKG